MNCATGQISMAHQWRNGFCATAIGALRKNQWRIGCSIGFFQWRTNGATTHSRRTNPDPSVYSNCSDDLPRRWVACAAGDGRHGTPARQQRGL
jgi:hypothetical protein